MSAAQDDVDRAHQAHPLQGADRVRALYQDLEPNLPPWAHDLRAGGQLITAEVTTQRPLAETRVFKDGSYACVLSSGYFRLLSAFAADIAGSIDFLPDETSRTPSLSSGDAVARIVTLLRQYRGMSEGYALDTYPIELQPWEQTYADSLAHRAALFTLAHELGHVRVSHNRIATRAVEHDADMLAFLLMLASAGRLDFARSYGGGFLAVRLHVCLEAAGVAFHSPGASLANRVEFLTGAVFDEPAKSFATAVAVAWEQAVIDRLLTAVEQTLRAMP